MRLRLILLLTLLSAWATWHGRRLPCLAPHGGASREKWAGLSELRVRGVLQRRERWLKEEEEVNSGVVYLLPAFTIAHRLSWTSTPSCALPGGDDTSSDANGDGDGVGEALFDLSALGVVGLCHVQRLPCQPPQVGPGGEWGFTELAEAMRREDRGGRTT